MTIGSTPPPGGMPRAVLDTSVLLSQDRHWLWMLARLRYYEGVWSTFIVGELVRIRVEHSIARGVERAVYRQRINDLVHLLSDALLVAHYPAAARYGMLDDPDDEPILATALAGGASIIVSLNDKDFPPHAEILGVRFLTPQAFLTVLETRHPHTQPRARAGDATGERLLP